MSPLPYPGLRPFQRNEIDIFFGRETHVDQLITCLGQTHFLTVVGPSGCGKSSLVRAGLLAHLETGFLAKAGTRWWIAEMRPGDRPFARLAEALLATPFSQAYQLPTLDQTQTAAFLRTELRRVPLGLHAVLRDTPLPNDTNLLLLVDQFEEIFRYCQQDKGRSNRAIDTAEAFVALLLASCQPSPLSQQPRIYIVITLRSDFIGDCALFHGLPEAINDSLFLTPRLTREQLHDAIVMPSRVFGGSVEPELVNQLLNTVGSEPDQLPLLQHTLARIWNITHKSDQPALMMLTHYHDIGGLTTALSQHAEEAYQELNTQQQQIAEILFRSLSEGRREHQDMRRPVKLGEVARLANVSWEQVAKVVDIFRRSDRNFLMPAAGIPLQPASVLDISHESLIRQWQRLKTWVDKETESAEYYRHLKDSAHRYKTGWGTLLQGSALTYALTWRQENHPTAQWAKRYGRYFEFELAMGFLDASVAHQREETKRHQDEIKRHNQLQRARKIIVLASIGLIGLLGVTAWISWEREKALIAGQNARYSEHRALASERKARLGQFESQLTNAALLARLEDYMSASKILAKSELFKNNIPIARHRTRTWLTEFVDMMSAIPQNISQNIGTPLYAVAVGPQGHWVAAAGQAGTLSLFNLVTQQRGKKLLKNSGKDINALAFHPQGNWLASAGTDQVILFWAMPSGEILEKRAADFAVNALAVNTDGAYLAYGGEAAHIVLQETATGETTQVLSRPKKKVTFNGLAFHPSQPLLASAYDDGIIFLWNWQTGKKFKMLMGHADVVYSVNFSSDGQWLASSSQDQGVRVWDINTGQTIHELRGHQDVVYNAQFLTDHHRLISASNDQTLRIWDVDNEFALQVLQGHRSGVNDIARYQKDAHNIWIFSASDDGTLRRWQVPLPLPYEEKVHQIALPDRPLSVAIAARHVAIGFMIGDLRLYTFPQMVQQHHQEDAHTQEIRCLRFSSDGRLLASGSYDGQVKLWQVEKSGELSLLHTWVEHTGEIYAVAFSPDDRLLATASNDGRIGLFAVKAPAQPTRLEAAHQGEGVLSVAFDNTGTQLLSGGRDGYTRLWQSADGHFIEAHAFKAQGQITSVSFSPDNRWFASVGQDLLIHVYERANSREKKTLGKHQNVIYRAIFSQDSQRIITVSSDATLRMWDLENEIELFNLRLPAKPFPPEAPLRDFDFYCMPQKNCYIAIPLTMARQLALIEAKIEFPLSANIGKSR